MKIAAKFGREMKLVLAAAVVLSLTAVGHAQQAVRWKFTNGEAVNYVMERAIDGKINFSGADIEFKLKMTFDTTWNVKAVAADGTASVEQSLDRMQVQMDSPLGGALDFDSASPTKPDSPAWAMIKPLVDNLLGQSLKWKVSPLGKVTDIELPEKLVTAFAEQEKGGRRQGFGLGGNMFSDRGIREFIQNSVQPLPDAAPGKDVTWKQTFENPIPRMGKQYNETTFAFAGPDTIDGKKVEKITAVTELTFEPDDEAVGDLEITSQKSAGTIYFDPAAGRAIKSENLQESKFELSGAQDLTQDTKEKSSMRLGKSPAPKPKEKTDDKPAEKK